ncbi:MAG: DNRLRE domain-containing protein [Deltaproteobacteria bacterium]|nr:DNRLRE domain-containing protein [Deltaproteobacteria bacterium]
MTDGLPFSPTLPPYALRSEHCRAVQVANRCEDPQQGDGEQCCFYCDIPELDDLCRHTALVARCQEDFPDSYRLCYFVVTRYIITVTIEFTFPGATYIQVVEREVRTSDINCFESRFQGVEDGEVPTGSGPLVFLRTEYPQGASGQVRIAGVSRDDLFGSSTVAFWLDGQPVDLTFLRTDLYDPYTCGEVPSPFCNPFSGFEGYLDTTSLSNGDHVLEVVALNNRRGDEIPTYYRTTLKVDNSDPCDETVPPSAAVSSPSPGSTVSGTVAVNTAVADSSGVDKVIFYVDGVWSRRDETAPFSYSWNTTSLADGDHQLQVRAVDNCGNGAWSEPVMVSVANSVPTTVQFPPSDDSWVNQDNPDFVYGHYNFLRVRTTAGGNGRHGYMKFSVNGITGPVTSVKLRLRSQDQPIHSFQIWRLMDATWSESTLTWNNAPLSHDWNSGEQTGWPAETWREFDLTDAVTGNGVYAFGLTTGFNQGLLDFWSKESVIYSPVLEVTFLP